MLLNFQISGPNLVEPNAFGPVLVCAPGFSVDGQTRVCLRNRNLRLRGRERDINFKDDLVSIESGVSRGVRVRVIQLGGGRGQSPAENKTETSSLGKQSRNLGTKQETYL